MSRINVAQLFEERKHKLSLTWEAGREAETIGSMMTCLPIQPRV